MNWTWTVWALVAIKSIIQINLKKASSKIHKSHGRFNKLNRAEELVKWTWKTNLGCQDLKLSIANNIKTVTFTTLQIINN